MKYPKLISIFIVILSFAGCSVKKYYFPISELSNGKVYKYECKLEPTKTEYWKLTSDLKDNTLVSEAFRSDFKQYEFFKEKITDKGTEVIEFISYFKNKKGIIFPVKNTPKDVDVFRWKTKETYKYSSENQYDSTTKMIFSKERKYIGKVKINILGKEYEAAKFKGSYKTVIANSTEKFEYIQFSYYAKGIGLAKMEKKYSDKTTETLELTEIMTIAEWNKSQ